MLVHIVISLVTLTSPPKKTRWESGNSGSNIHPPRVIRNGTRGFRQSPLGRLWRGVVLVALAWPLSVSDQQRGRISLRPNWAEMVRLWAFSGPPLSKAWWHWREHALTIATEMGLTGTELELAPALSWHELNGV